MHAIRAPVTLFVVTPRGPISTRSDLPNARPKFRGEGLHQRTPEEETHWKPEEAQQGGVKYIKV